MSEAATPDTGALTFDAAVASLIPAETAEQEEQAAEAPVGAAEGEQSEGETSAPEDAADGAETPAEEAEALEEPEPVVAADPPAYWSQDAKAKFAELPPELQAVVLQQEGPREEAAAKAKAEAAEVRKVADAELGKVSKLAEELASFLPQALETFQSRWGSDPDWVAYAQEHGAEAMTLAKAQHDQDLSQLQRLASAKQTAEAQAHEAYVKSEFAKLSEIAPELADPQKGSAARQAVTQYLVNQGIEPEAIRQISASEMLIADKARRWDEAQAALRAAPKPKPAAPAPKAPVRPAAAASAPHPTKQAVGRFHAAPTVDNAVALLLANKA